MENGQILSLIIALSKKQVLKYGSIGITNILPDYKDNSINFMLANGTTIKYSMNTFNYMKLTDFDKDNDGIIDLADIANFAKESEKSRDSLKLNGKEASLYFQKDTDSTDNIVEGNNKKFISQFDKDKLSNIPININSELQNKMDKNIYDNNNNGIVDKAETLIGMTITIDDMNKLLGIKNNVQAQIDSLKNALTIRKVLNTYADLTAISIKNNGDAYIINVDESTQGNNNKTWYVWNGIEWLFLGTMSAELRNFLLNPLNLSTETTGILPQSKVDLTGIAKNTDLHFHNNKSLLDGYTQSDVDLKDTVSKKHSHNNKDALDKLSISAEGKLLFNNNLIEGTDSDSVDLSNYYNKTEMNNKIGIGKLETVSQDLISAINEVKQQSFQNGVNAKNKVVTALTSRGMKVTTDNTFEELGNAIIALTIPPSTLQTTKLNCMAGEKKIINYGRDLSDFKFTTSVLKFQQGELGVTQKICSYNNTDSTNFVYDENRTIFDGKMKPKNDFIITPTNTRLVDTKTEYIYHIKKSNYKDIQGAAINDDNTLIIKAIMPPYVLYGKGDIDIKNIEKLKKINLNVDGYKVLLSFDKGDTWKSYYNNSWVDADINSLSDVKLKAMDKVLLDILTDVQLEVIRNDSNTIKFAYYQEENNINDSVYTDELDLVIDMKGRDVVANQVDWGYRIYDDNMSVEYTFNIAGTFTINRI